MRESRDELGWTDANDTRLPWVEPNYVRTRAGDAEIGPNPDLSDGPFTKS